MAKAVPTRFSGGSSPASRCPLRMFNIIPSHIVCGLGIAGMGALPYGLRWLIDEVGATGEEGSALGWGLAMPGQGGCGPPSPGSG